MLFIADRIEQFDYLLQKNHYAYHQAAVQWRRGLYNMSIKSCQKSRNFHLANQSAVKKTLQTHPVYFVLIEFRIRVRILISFFLDPNFLQGRIRSENPVARFCQI